MKSCQSVAFQLRRRTCFATLLACSFFIVGHAQANDTSHEVRPSHLLNVETAGTLKANDLVLSMFGTNGGRAAWGVTDRFEARADYAWNTLVDTGTSYNLAATGKYHLWNDDIFGAGIQGTVSNAKAVTTTQSAVTNFIGRLPLTVALKSFLFTAVGVVSKTTVSDSPTIYGGEFGLAFPAASFADVIGEYTVLHSTGVTRLGWVGGVAFKPANRVTIPLVLMSGNGGSNTGTTNKTVFGVVNFLAHVGFEL